MDKISEVTLLLDFYGQLLTKRQYEIFELHYNNDLSLAEIAEQLNISRQGVFDSIKRGKTLLYQMEEKLGLVKKFLAHKKKAEGLLMYLSELERESLEVSTREILRKVEEGLKEIIDEF